MLEHRPPYHTSPERGTTYALAVMIVVQLCTGLRALVGHDYALAAWAVAFAWLCAWLLGRRLWGTHV